MSSELRDYQLRALENIRLAVKSGVKRLAVEAPTGSGKTKIAAAIVEGGRAKGNKLAFVVPSISLIDQTVEAFYADGIREIGVIQANHEMTDWSRPVQIASIQTIRARKTYPECQTVIFDECHQLHEEHKRWITHPDWQKVPMIGFSATPWTKGLGKYFQSLLVAAKTQELIDEGYLSPFKIYATGHPDLKGVRITAGDFNEGDLSSAMQKGNLTADIVKTYCEKWGKGKTLCFGVDKAHAKSIQERFEFAGIRCGYQDADTPADERREIKRKFHEGAYEVVSNIQTLTTGVDWDVRCLILARPTRSEMLYTQIIGRALRTALGKDHAVILDHSDTTQRLGFVTDIHHDELDDGKPMLRAARKEQMAMAKECRNCAFLKPPRVVKCPNCGHEDKATCLILEREGELIEYRRGLIAKAPPPVKYTMTEKAIFYAELRAYAIQHRYHDGWVAHKYREKFKVWPDHRITGAVPAKLISPGTLLWIRHQNMKRALGAKHVGR